MEEGQQHFQDVAAAMKCKVTEHLTYLRTAPPSSAKWQSKVGRLSGVSGKEAVKAFGILGYSVDHQTGSDMILYHRDKSPLSVPNHRELAPGLLRGLLRKADIDVDEFLRILKKG